MNQGLEFLRAARMRAFDITGLSSRSGNMSDAPSADGSNTPAAAMPAVSEPQNLSETLKSFQNCISSDFCALKNQVEVAFPTGGDALSRLALQAHLSRFRICFEGQLDMIKNDVVQILKKQLNLNSSIPLQMSASGTFVAAPDPSPSIIDLTAEEDSRPGESDVFICGVCHEECNGGINIIKECGHFPFCHTCVRRLQISRQNTAQHQRKRITDVPLRCPACTKPTKNQYLINFVPDGVDVDEV